MIDHFMHAVSKSGVLRIAISGGTWIWGYRGGRPNLSRLPSLTNAATILLDSGYLNENALVSVDDQS